MRAKGDANREVVRPGSAVRAETVDREWCAKHRCWYVPSTGPMDSAAEPCPGCVTEAEAIWRDAEDHNLRTVLGLPNV